jgi:hypothetical protein
MSHRRCCHTLNPIVTSTHRRNGYVKEGERRIHMRGVHDCARSPSSHRSRHSHARRLAPSSRFSPLFLRRIVALVVVQVPTSISRSCGRRSRVMCSSFCCASDAGSTGQQHHRDAAATPHHRIPSPSTSILLTHFLPLSILSVLVRPPDSSPLFTVLPVRLVRTRLVVWVTRPSRAMSSTVAAFAVVDASARSPRVSCSESRQRRV